MYSILFAPKKEKKKVCCTYFTKGLIYIGPIFIYIYTHIYIQVTPGVAIKKEKKFTPGVRDRPKILN